MQGFACALESANLNGPEALVVVPGCAQDFGFKTDVGLDLVFVHDGLEVGLELWLLCEVLAPRIAWFKAVAIEVVPDVNPSTGIGVLPPRSPHTRILFNDDKWNPGFFEPDSCQQA